MEWVLFDSIHGITIEGEDTSYQQEPHYSVPFLVLKSLQAPVVFLSDANYLYLAKGRGLSLAAKVSVKCFAMECS